MLKYIYMEDFEIKAEMAKDLFKLSYENNLKKLNKDCEKSFFFSTECIIYEIFPFLKFKFFQ